MAQVKMIAATLATAGLLTSGLAQATLLDRGGGLIYDDVLNITWLQDSNYAQTSGFDADGRMNWSDANTWAAGLSYFDSYNQRRRTHCLALVTPSPDLSTFQFDEVNHARQCS